MQNGYICMLQNTFTNNILYGRALFLFNKNKGRNYHKWHVTIEDIILLYK